MITQREWAEALVEAWKKDLNLSVALLIAHKSPQGVTRSSEEWEAMIASVSELTPKIAPKTMLNQRVQSWIARNAFYANNALWDGRFDKAVELMVKGGKSHKPRPQTEVKRLERSDNRLTISVRERDKRTDWKTVK